MANTFLQHCEEAANDPYTARGLKGGCLVNLKALRELIFHFKRLDNEVRQQFHLNESAPALLEALESAKSKIECSQRAHERASVILVDEALEIIDAAIAAARGEV